jgi:biopolymer transport protein ExbD
MKIARKPRPFGDIDVTSFSDIAFLLIIFFVLTTTFVKTMGLAVVIPSSTQDPAKKSEGEYPTLVLTAETMQFQDKEISMDQLREKLADMKLPEKKEEQRFIVLESAPEVSYDRYFEVVTAISKLGGILAIAEPTEESKNKEAQNGDGGTNGLAVAAGGAA